MVGSFELAGEGVQDAFASVIVASERDGVSADPGAWLTAAAGRRVIDCLRRGPAQTDRAERLGALLRKTSQS